MAGLEYAPYMDGDLKEWVVDKYPYRFSERRAVRDADGNLVVDEDDTSPWTRYKTEVVDGEWRKNEPFRAFLTYDSWYKGRSAVRINWRDQDGHKYPMFMKDFDALMHSGKIGAATSNGQDFSRTSSAFGFWHVVKRGANYGLALLEEE